MCKIKRKNIKYNYIGKAKCAVKQELISLLIDILQKK